MQKERFDIIASSLSSYFGVGFQTVQEQLDIDLGIVPKEIDDESQDRMDLGNIMENACMDYFEKKMTIVIDERNSETKYACDGKLKCKRDGRTFLDGVETGWENKYSNAQQCFTDDLGYMIQCQAYMMAFGLSQWVLAGMWQGKPVYRLIKADPEIQADIEVIVNAVYDILTGISTIEDYPWDIVAKYSAQKKLVNLEEDEISDYDKKVLLAIGKLNVKKKEIEEKLETLKNYAKSKFADSTYKDDFFKYTITSSNGRSSFDKHLFSIENPTIDIEKYYIAGTPYQTIKTTAIKKKEGA
jgi:hypothetical protein